MSSRSLKKVEMILLYIQDHTDLREKMEETVRVLTGLSKKCTGTSDTDIAPDGFENAANGDGRIQIASRRMWEIMEVVVVFRGFRRQR